MPLRSSNRSSQQRVTWSKHDQTWSLQRPQLHEINYLKKTVNTNNVACDIKRKLCHHGDDPKCCCRSQCMSKCMFSMVKTTRTQHTRQIWLPCMKWRWPRIKNLKRQKDWHWSHYYSSVLKKCHLRSALTPKGRPNTCFYRRFVVQTGTRNFKHVYLKSFKLSRRSETCSKTTVRRAFWQYNFCR